MKLVLSGAPPWDGEYEMDFTFTNREMHRIKQISGLRGSEVLDALMNDDWGGFVAVAAVVLERSGKRVDLDELWDAKAGSLRIDATEEAPSRPLDGATSESNSSEPDANGSSSGPSSSDIGENQETILAGIGSPGSETSAESA